MNSTVITIIKLSLIIALIGTAGFIVIAKDLLEGLIFLIVGFLVLYLWLFLDCCWVPTRTR